MKYRFSFRLLIVWLFLLAVTGLYLMLFAPRGAVESEDENRMLAAFPTVSYQSVTSGEFSDGLESFLSDKLPARSSLASMTKYIMGLFSILTDEELLDREHDTFAQGLIQEGSGDVSPSDVEEPEEAELEEDTAKDSGLTQPSAEGSGIMAIQGKTLVPTVVEDYGDKSYVQDDTVLSRETGIDYPVMTGQEAPSELKMRAERTDGTEYVHYTEKRADVEQATEIYNRLAGMVDGNVNVLIPPESVFAMSYLKNRGKYTI